MTTAESRSAKSQFAGTVGRLGLTTVATSALAMLYKLAMPRALGPSELAQLFFAETFPFLFFALVPLGIGTYITRELAGRPERARETLPSILAFEAVAGAIAFCTLVGALLWRPATAHGPWRIVATMGISCLLIVLQQRILRPTFIALGAAHLVTRIEIAAKLVLAPSILLTLALRPDLQIITAVHAAVESGAVCAYLWAASRNGWLGGTVRFATIRKVILESLPYSAVTVMMALNGNVDSTLFSHLASPHELGLYAAANRVGLIVMFGVSVVLSSVPPMLGRLVIEAPKEYASILSGVARFICAAGLPATVAFTLLAPEVAQLLFGAEFAAAWRTLAAYGPYTLVVAYNLLIACDLGLRGKSRTFALAYACSLTLNIGLGAAGIIVARDHFGEGAVGAGRLVAGAVCDLVSAGFFLYLTRGQVRGRTLLSMLLRALVPSVAVTTLMLSGALNSWYLRGATIVLIPFYMFAVGLIKRGDKAAVIDFINAIFKKQTPSPAPDSKSSSSA